MKKLRLVALRLLQLVPVLIGISVITFVLAQATPGDPVRLIVGQRATEEVIAAVRQQYGLDEPIFVQYFVYVKNLPQGDWGRSIAFRGPVLDFILSRVTPTLYLVVVRPPIPPRRAHPRGRSTGRAPRAMPDTRPARAALRCLA